MSLIDDSKDICIYRIDEKDRILFVGGNWYNFAIENDGGDCGVPGAVLGRTLWQFIDGNQVIHLYRILVEKVRTHQTSLTVPIHCDSPDVCREIDVTMHPLPESAVEFNCRVLHIHRRKPLELLGSGIERSDALIRICSFCKKIALSENEWAETEQAVRILKLFGGNRLPGLTHGLCPDCFSSAMAEIDRIPADPPEGK